MVQWIRNFPSDVIIGTKLWLFFCNSHYFCFKPPTLSSSRKLQCNQFWTSGYWRSKCTQEFSLFSSFFSRWQPSSRVHGALWFWAVVVNELGMVVGEVAPGCSAVVAWPTLVTTQADCAICPQLWSLLLTGFRQLVCALTGARGLIIATWEGTCLFPRMCSGGRERPQGGNADSGRWHFMQRWLKGAREALWTGYLLFSALKSLSFGFIIFSSPHGFC